MLLGGGSSGGGLFFPLLSLVSLAHDVAAVARSPLSAMVRHTWGLWTFFLASTLLSGWMKLLLHPTTSQNVFLVFEGAWEMIHYTLCVAD